jgi:phosphocarrier protein HPr
MMWMILQWIYPALAADEVRAWPHEYKPASERACRRGAKKAEKEIVIVNHLGLHARPAALFAQGANRFRADVWVEKESTEVNGKSILGLMMLGGNKGSKLRIRVEGQDAYEAMREIERLIQSWLGEDQRTDQRKRIAGVKARE